ncbi:MAG: hypothetical protein HQL30_05680 [Candidatus Omnitrophica bacterium]|nr:hypothetical protein [Candidatus Omnitrophota bacterium]
MSIISDALKKAQEKRDVPPKSRQVPKPPRGLIYPELLPAPPTKKHFFNAAKLLFSSVLLAFILFSSAIVMFNIYPRAKQDIHTPVKISGNATQPLKVAGAVTEDHYEPSPNIVSYIPVLNGIMYSTEDAKAVIDGKIARRGDKLNSYTVVEIHSDKVTLASEDGKKTDLKL